MIKAVLRFSDDSLSIHSSDIIKVDTKFEPGFYKCYSENGKTYIDKVQLSETNEPFDLDIFHRIISYCERFYNKELHAKVNAMGFNHKLGVLLYGKQGTGKCLGKGTEVLMYDGTIEKVEDLVEGDLLMGPDSKSRKIISLGQGKEEMFNIIPNKGEQFSCNRSHILSLVASVDSGTYKKGEIYNISVEEYLNMKYYLKRNLLLWSVPIDFNNSDELEFDPYAVGLWLAEGSKETSQIHSGDQEAIDEFCSSFPDNYSFSETQEKGCKKVRVKTVGVQDNPFLNFCKNQLVNPSNEKTIPIQYLTSNRENRLRLLAGILDGDGSLDSKGFDIICKDSSFSRSLTFLVRSLGFRCTNTLKRVKLDSWGGQRTYFRSFISGDTHLIPTVIPRKKAGVRKQIKNPLRTGFEVQSIGQGDYYGFELEGDGLFCLSSFMVTHNTTFLYYLANKIVKELGGIVFVCSTSNNLGTSIGLSKSVREIQPNPIVFIGDEFDRWAQSAESEMKNFLDGEDSIDNMLFLAATNYIEKIPKTLSDRPSRFKAKYEIKEIVDADIIEGVIRDKSELISLFSDKEIKEYSKMLAEKGCTLDEIKQFILDHVLGDTLDIEDQGSIGFKEEKSDIEKALIDFRTVTFTLDDLSTQDWDRLGSLGASTENINTSPIDSNTE